MAHKSPIDAGIYIHNSFIHGISAEVSAIRQHARRHFKTAPAELQHTMDSFGNSLLATSMHHALDCVDGYAPVHLVDSLGDSAKATWGGPSQDGRGSPCSTACAEDGDLEDAGRTRTPPSDHSSESLADAEDWPQEEAATSSDNSPALPKQERRPSSQGGKESVSQIPSGRAAKLKFWVHFYLDPEMLEASFCLCKKIIGTKGQNMKDIHDATDAKIRLRGRGSGHKEHNGWEANVPLMLAVTTPMSDMSKFQDAINRAMDLLENVEEKFRRKRGEHRSEHHVCIGGLSDGAKASLDTNERAQRLLERAPFQSCAQHNRAPRIYQPAASRRGGKGSRGSWSWH
mmetsp:Transcript_75340/g.140493  ORF Transcript_75340/g.140493 Transcript_75340/m.140493 type:complete len:343 (+) Transcript_75340:70-1098(+)